LRSLASPSGPLRLRPAAPNGSPTCMPLQLPPLRFWPTPYHCDHGRLLASRTEMMNRVGTIEIDEHEQRWPFRNGA
jgi:hypothetical protein